MTGQRPDPIEYLTGRTRALPYPPGVSAPGGGGKFATDGRVQPWPGNTFICHLRKGSAAYETLLHVQERIRMSPFSGFFAFLPPPSFHMTLFQGVSPGNRPGQGWPDDIAEGTPLTDVTARLDQRIADAVVPETFRLTVDGLFALQSVRMSGADPSEVDALRQARTALRQATRITFPDFDRYTFHITLAYQIHWVSADVARQMIELSDALGAECQQHLGQVELGPIEFCSFETMHHFEVRRRLHHVRSGY